MVRTDDADLVLIAEELAGGVVTDSVPCAAVMAPTINAGPTATSRNVGSSACLRLGTRNRQSP